MENEKGKNKDTLLGLFPNEEDYDDLSSKLSLEEEKDLLFKAVELAEQHAQSNDNKEALRKKRKNKLR